MVDGNCKAAPVGVEILEDLRATIAGAACLITASAPADDLDCARNLLTQARERAGTLREVLRHE